MESRAPSDESLAQTDSPPSTEHMKFENKKKEKQLKQQLEIGKQKFNVDPEMVPLGVLHENNSFFFNDFGIRSQQQGIKYFLSMEVLEHTPESIAKFLRDNAEGIDKSILGSYLCKG